MNLIKKKQILDVHNHYKLKNSSVVRYLFMRKRMDLVDNNTIDLKFKKHDSNLHLFYESCIRCFIISKIYAF